MTMLTPEDRERIRAFVNDPEAIRQSAEHYFELLFRDARRNRQ